MRYSKFPTLIRALFSQNLRFCTICSSRPRASSEKPETSLNSIEFNWIFSGRSPRKIQKSRPSRPDFSPMRITAWLWCKPAIFENPSERGVIFVESRRIQTLPLKRPIFPKFSKKSKKWPFLAIFCDTPVQKNDRKKRGVPSLWSRLEKSLIFPSKTIRNLPSNNEANFLLENLRARPV